VEKAYYRKTGLFPVMHLIGIKRHIVEQHPWLPASLYKAFLQAKEIALREVKEINALPVTLPWLVAEAQETVELMGQDFWRYGVQENIKEIETLTRYAYEQGLVSRKLSIEDLFPPSVVEVNKV
jgi:4,5-dihydroxyphthalate decarboxylase